MARKQPRVLACTDHGTLLEEVCEAHGVYAIMYNGQPFTIRKKRVNCNNYEYQSTVYLHPGNANRLCKQLNDKYTTEEFTVEVLKCP